MTIKYPRQRSFLKNYHYVLPLTPHSIPVYREALEIDPFNRTTNSKLYFNRATVQSKLGKLEQSIEDCSKAIELDTNYVKAYLRLYFFIELV